MSFGTISTVIERALFPTTPIPRKVMALKGDEHGVYRIRVVGNSGTGKSTLAKDLGATLDIPVLHLDTLAWKPGWVMRTDDDFRSFLRSVLLEERFKNGWVTDGNYFGMLVDELDSATDIIWLDPPFILYFSRLIKRTFLRLLRIAPPCAPGCNERASEAFFSRDSSFWWTITNHWRVKRRMQRALLGDDAKRGGRIRRIGGWGSDLREWKMAVEYLARGKRTDAYCGHIRPS